MKMHELKCWPEFFHVIESGLKNFEIRKDDRNFQPGDWLRLREYLPSLDRYTGNECLRQITYLTTFEQQHGYVVLALADEAEKSAAGSLLLAVEAKAKIEAMLAWCVDNEGECLGDHPPRLAAARAALAGEEEEK